MNIGNKVLITGGTDVNWTKNSDQPWYIKSNVVNNITNAYKSKEICTIVDIEKKSEELEIITLENSDGEKLTGFYNWELSLATNEI